MDGYTVAAKLKGNPDSASIPIIALTAHAMKGDKEKILAAGCDDYISKPIDPENIIAAINTWLKEK